MNRLLITALAMAACACNAKDPAAGKAPAATASTAKTAAAAPSAAKAPATTAPAAPAAAPLTLEPLDVTGDEFSATMQAPKGATAKDSYGTLEVKLGDGKAFNVWIDAEAPDMAKVKAGIEQNDVQKLKTFHVETADTFIYETEAFGKASVWLDAAIKVGDTTVHCYSGRGAHSYTRAQIDGFLKACESLKPKG